ncbi:uncharacterized protein TRAVEDRAFT_40630 [Trametes versicolor FP-101664 SS1]|uniref:uncharacterized protein n=1 Tax=Trametes versicolor (strain FP-101664) TaxID=717944 RepID=UPI000462213B|nr:uncharacterized protein TRAVEDRAFT_40630 [Trametes versicolor FP-101664 SS1]EIW52271.1 hypothetical protein TRAVEDRAFT_40630 [Trametes versicolor FP-101664 SS1]
MRMAGERLRHPTTDRAHTSGMQPASRMSPRATLTAPRAHDAHKDTHRTVLHACTGVVLALCRLGPLGYKFADYKTAYNGFKPRLRAYSTTSPGRLIAPLPRRQPPSSSPSAIGPEIAREIF